MKRLLITGANSYIGSSLDKYIKEHYSSDIFVDTIDMIDGSWKNKAFSSYDVVFHVAGIAHVDVGKSNEATKQRYYSVNTDLAIETCKKAKSEGVKQFVFMSSVIIYGESASFKKQNVITKDSVPSPVNCYGDSKWKAELGIRELENEDFIVTVLRPPMIYGKGCKGNYPKLSKIAKKSPFFPLIENERSILYVENLCEFLCQVIMRGERGIFWPQNPEYIQTSNIVKLISSVNNHRVFVSKGWNWLVYISRVLPGKPRKLADKAFGNLVIDKSLSKYDFDYQIYSLEESIRRTEE